MASFRHNIKKKKERYESTTDIAAQNTYKSKVDEAYKAWKVAETILQKMTSNMFNEFNRFSREKTAALKEIFGLYAKGQNVFYARIASTWNIIAPI